MKQHTGMMLKSVKRAMYVCRAVSMGIGTDQLALTKRTGRRSAKDRVLSAYGIAAACNLSHLSAQHPQAYFRTLCSPVALLSNSLDCIVHHALQVDVGFELDGALAAGLLGGDLTRDVVVLHLD